MSEQIKKITSDTLIPLGLIITLASIIFYSGMTAQRLTNVEKRVDDHEATIKNMPTRNEFIKAAIDCRT